MRPVCQKSFSQWRSWETPSRGKCGPFVAAETGRAAAACDYFMRAARTDLPLVVPGELIRRCIRPDGVSITAPVGTGVRFIVNGSVTEPASTPLERQP